MSGVDSARPARSGRGTGWRARRLLACALVLAVAGCFTGYGFTAGGLPRHIRTAAVLPFENETPVAELQSELTDVVRTQLQRRLGVRDAAESRADAVVRGVITRYDPDMPIAVSADPNQGSSARRKLSIVMDIEIVDQSDGSVLFERKGLKGEGEYGEGAEASGRKVAMERIATQIVEGAQSQW